MWLVLQFSSVLALADSWLPFTVVTSTVIDVISNSLATAHARLAKDY
jgi:hypothetical protein